MANVKISALSALNTVDSTAIFPVVSNTTGTLTTYNTTIANITTAVLSNGNSNISILANSSLLFSSNGNANSMIISSNRVSIEGELWIPGTTEETTGNSYVLGMDAATGNVGFDSTIYYNHDTEALVIGNLQISDTPAATGVSISTAESGADGSIFFSVNAGQVMTLTGDRRVKLGLLTYANIPNAAVGSMIYNNDTANTANGFYVCNDGTVTQVWEKVITSKNGVTYLVPQTSAPTAVAGGIYYDSTQKKFFMCANVSLGWQQVNLT